MNTETYLLKKVDELDAKITALHGELMAVRTEDLTKLYVAIAGLRARSGLWGATAAIMTVVGALLLRMI